MSQNMSPLLKKSIILDAFQAGDLRSLNIMYACEQCTYFEEPNRTCNLGFKSEPHQKAAQDRLYNLTGKMALCRFMEID